MHQTKKGNQCHSGMKGHIGVDSKSGLIQFGGGHSRQHAR